MALLNLLHLVSHVAFNWHLKPVSRLIDNVSRLVHSAAIPGETKIGRNVTFHHGGLGVVLNKLAVIESDCHIGVHVVLGGRAPLKGAPYLERGVVVHSGAKIVGPVRIGAGSVIAANAVVLTDVPPASLVAGVPGVIKRSNIDVHAYLSSVTPIDGAS